MSRLPPVAKFPLSARKNIRDQWDNKKTEFEAELSKVLGVPWTVEIDLPQVAAYAKDGSFAAESPGSMLAEYVSGATRRLSDFISSNGDTGKDEINNICSSHVLTMDVDLTDEVSYCGAQVVDKKLVILFNKDNLSSNAADAFGRQALTKALNDAPSEGLSYLARKSVEDYNKGITEVQSIINDQFGKEIVLDPGFDAAYEKLKTAKTKDGFDENLGSFILGYFRGLAKTLERNKVKEDDMVQEALNEAAEFGKVSFRIVNPGEMKASYGEAIFEDGVLYLQTDTEYYGSNIEDVADKVIDQL